MADAKVFYRKATADFPLSVYYFSPTHIDRKPQPLHRVKTLSILLMHTGEVEFYTAGGMVLLTAGDICLVPPQTLQAFRTVSLQTRYTLLGLHPALFSFSSSHFFSREFFQPLQSGKLKIPQLLCPGDGPYAEILTQMQRLDVEKEGTDAYTMELLSVAMNICTTLYPYCSSGEPETSPSVGQSASEKCLQYIRDHFRQKLTLQDIAAHVHLHPNYLCALFHEQTGKTVFEQLNWVRVHEASKLLRGTDLPISQIAAQCGFQNPNFFARKFKATLGRSPTAYRKIAREEAKHKKGIDRLPHKRQ